MTVEKETEFLEGLQNSKNSTMILGRIKNQIVSISNLSASNKTRLLHAAELGTCVIKAHWHLGVGTAMMEYLITWAKRSGIIRKIDLSARTTNHRAIQLYEELGFKKEGTKTRSMFINGEFCDTVEMGLQID
ncbi:MAG: GNAT family N-acetyltransferase [Promethearchaeota archaeon]